MLRRIGLVVACVALAAGPAAAKAKKKHPAHVAHHARAKSPRRLRLAKTTHHAAPTPLATASLPSVTSAPPATSAQPTLPTPAPEPAPSAMVDRGPMTPQASDDEVPGSRMKR